ncbi:MAG: anthranilate synthase component I [Actinobacteria bacterium]|nr:anthranilate synthase component I [Actinomycetota bacterium]
MSSISSIYPSKEEYQAKAKKYNLIPVYKEYMVDTETPTSIFLKAGGSEKEMFLLESMEGLKKLSRYSFIGAGNSSLIKFEDEVFTMKTSGKEVVKVKTKSPLDELEKVINEYRLYKNPELNHFVGGAVGYLSYDLVKYFENIKLAKDKLSLPEIMLYLTDLVIVFDHFLNRMKIISTVKIEKDTEKDTDKAYFQSIKKIEEIESKIFLSSKNGNGNNFSYLADNTKKFDIKSNFSKQKFLEAVKKAKKYIIDGEAFQIVLSQRFSIDSLSNPFNIYRALRTTNPSPYMYYINFGKFKIIGSSPEPLIKINGRKILTCPIAGTKKRGASPKEERFLVSSLLNDEKEMAEHNMLVDLSRNDLGRVCKFGSIKIKKYMSVEKYSHVIHLVSRIEGTLDKTSTIYDALKSTFPAGTLTGAPKIRAMQIISELEPDCRGPYGGVVGYFGYDGSLDTCITIRTAIIKDGKAYIQAGAGIVYDSVPENEWNETLNKAGALFKAIKLIN